MSRLPNALLVGPQRSGTTWAYRYLSGRPDVVCPTRVKETFFFDLNYERGADWYRAFFDGDGGAARVAEVAPTYFHDPAVPGRVLDLLGRIPIVVTLRNPVERIRSLYLHFLRRGDTRHTAFGLALAELPVLVDSSRYATHLRRWRELLGDDAVHVLFYEDLEADPDNYVRSLCTALDLPYLPVAAEARGPVNRTTVAPVAALARVATRSAAALREIGLHRLVKAGKGLGLKRLMMGRDGNAEPEVDVSALAPHVPELAKEIGELEVLVGRALPEWRRDLEAIA